MKASMSIYSSHLFIVYTKAFKVQTPEYYIMVGLEASKLQYLYVSQVEVVHNIGHQNFLQVKHWDGKQSYLK